ncbi:MAG: multifunctional oxoglutarate decarboxylase/oxoglutarate dehydrogenase thiamine pyrophosphate-binding subunit/dihydrolipoyllysine-residue succinyltransferase subunit [Actinomycetia bacterium]|nr:multifunctional oxoglutarate decarboxylase/oxoglutarate dehydrogenase thiamine pyrophosphate-binding subunit/dihydrolipoyllysine-residue succinyltransferase subunit [Actinomycetes bacterium]
MTANESSGATGPNSWLIDELFDQYREDPGSVPEEWRAVFDQEHSSQAMRASTSNGSEPLAEAPTPITPAPAREPASNRSTLTPTPAPIVTPTVPPTTAPASAASISEPGEPEPGEPIRGVAARIVTNMEASLEVPTATSFREIPAKLLEINRKVLNNHLRRVRGGKVSFTHIIGYAVVKAVARTVPNLNNTYATGTDGKPRLVRSEHLNLGIAVDQEKADGSRSLIVPVIKGVEEASFAEFVDAYEEMISKVRANKLSIDDLTGATITVTNPGTIGTVQSVPRLMQGQGAIIGVGAIGYPAEYQAADPKLVAQLGISKIIAITSTYDHRIIQGAESGLFLKKVHELLLGEDNFYADAFEDMGVPYEAVQWRTDHSVVNDDEGEGAIAKQMAVSTLINQYRVRGHLIANTNPLFDSTSKNHPELDPVTYGLTIWDLDREFLTGNKDGIYAAVGGQAQKMPLGDILGVVRDAYSRTVGVEYMHIANPIEKRWIQEQVEGQTFSIDHEQQQHILERLSAAEAIEKFLATRYVGQKRFGIEGCESAIPTIDAILSAAADDHMDRAIIGMAHRGRLNVLVNILGKHHHDLFSEFEGAVDENAIQGGGDVKYHLGYEGKHTSQSGNVIDIKLAANPSHLEAVDPVVVGMARAYMDQSSSGDYPVLPVLLHGDAAFAGQGVVAETLNLSQVHGYRVGGTIHLIINNQLGYTTAPHQSRSSEYSTDVAKTVQAPIFHVNADDPEACVRVAQLAFDFRRRFKKDVVIDMIGYRRHGHNEGDDPSYTQPLMYRKIEQRPPSRTLYTQTLVDRGDITLEEAEQALDYFQSVLQQALDETRDDAPPAGIRAKPAPPPAGVLPHIETGVSRTVLDRVFEALTTTPPGFTIHPKLARQFDARNDVWAKGEVDWAMAEAFAIGSFLDQGISVRMAGQDTRRGTFAHRHATIHDYETGEEYTPLAKLAGAGTHFWVYDSTLSEYAGLGFEYGYSLAKPEVMVLWEAQFGDFINGAQIIIDQYLVGAEDKWNETTGLIMLLPHGYEGQGPEHSSARLERFLLLCAEDNIQVANVTTAAQYFHLIRRQMTRTVRKPLVVFTPKSGLRAKTTRSPIDAFTSGSFQEVLEDRAIVDNHGVKRVVLASGKVSTEALTRRNEIGAMAASVIRVEQLYPWPFDAVAKAVNNYPNAAEIVWLQEEPENMGAWNAVKGHLHQAHGRTHEIRRVSRAESGSPATGSNAIHHQEQEELLNRAFGVLES